MPISDGGGAQPHQAAKSKPLKSIPEPEAKFSVMSEGLFA